MIKSNQKNRIKQKKCLVKIKFLNSTKKKTRGQGHISFHRNLYTYYIAVATYIRFTNISDVGT